jgi:hypothetical protein
VIGQAAAYQQRREQHWPNLDARGKSKQSKRQYRLTPMHREKGAEDERGQKRVDMDRRHSRHDHERIAPKEGDPQRRTAQIPEQRDKYQERRNIR